MTQESTIMELLRSGKKPTVKQARVILQIFNDSFHLWGKDGAKTVHALVKEIKRREHRLWLANGKLWLLSKSAWVSVWYQDEFGRIERLVEDYKVAPDGTVMRRELKIQPYPHAPHIFWYASFRGTARRGEPDAKTALREFREELGVKPDPKRMRCVGIVPVLEHPSTVFPGITRRESGEFFDYQMNKKEREQCQLSEFDKGSGYTTHFKWVVEEAPPAR